MPDQYNNPANPKGPLHHHSPRDLGADRRCSITHFLAGMGTSGTLMGTGARLKELNTATFSVIAMQPAEPLHGLEGLKHMPTSIVPGYL